ncbi:MAG: rod shape-determining protein MreD [Acidimicrobiia bacterium]|nr:rod shape-determining protein MreD [Acidimicrobiia bacterium]
MNNARAKVPLILLTFLVVELTVLDHLRVFGAGPDVMLLLAVVAGIVGGPRVGALFGFAAGIVLDLFLETPMGLSALVFCIVGYAVGNIQGGVLRAAWWIPVVTTFAASVAGVLLYALTATVVGQPGLVTPHLFVVAAVVGVFNAVVSPFALRLVRWAIADIERAERAYA